MANGITRRQSKERVGAPVTRIETISDGTINLDRVRYLPELPQQTIDKYRLVRGDILFSHINSDTHLGKTAIFNLDNLILLHGMNLLLLRSDKNSVVPEYLHYLCNHYRFSGVFVSIAQHAVNQSSINQRKLGQIPVPLAPLAEQHRIVAEIETQLSRLDAAVAALQRARENLRRYKASVLQAACTGRLLPPAVVGAIRAESRARRGESPSYEPAGQLLERILAERRRKWEKEAWVKEIARAKKKAAQAARKVAGRPARISDLTDAEWQDLPESVYRRYLPKDDKWKRKYVKPAGPDTQDLPELPAGWVWATVEELATHEPNAFTDGPFGSKLKTSHYTNVGPRVIRLQNIGNGEFRDEKAHISWEHFETLRRHEIFDGDIVIGALGVELPRACIVPGYVGPAIVKADCMRFKPHPELADARYLNAALNSEVLKKIAANIIHGVGRPRLNQQEVRSLPVPLPPFEEQLRISGECDRRLSIAKELESAVESDIARAGRLRQSILQRAFQGRLVPTEMELYRRGEVPSPSSPPEPAAALLARIRAQRHQGQTKAEKSARRKQKKPSKAGGQTRLPDL